MKQLMIVSLLALLPACKADDYTTPDERQRIDTLEEQGDQAGADAIRQGVAERTVGSVVDSVSPFIPVPLRPFTPLLAGLFFKRPRRLLGNAAKKTGTAVKDLVTGNPAASGAAVGDAVGDVLSLVGLRDSRNDTADDLKAWAELERAAGNTAMADAIEAKIVSDAAAA